MDGRQNNNFSMTVKDIAFIVMFTVILFVQEEALSFLPNIQLTVFLIVLYSKKLGFVKTAIIIGLHVILDNLVMGSFNLFYTPTMFIGWLLIPIIICTFFKKTNSPLILSFVGVLCSFLYCWCYIVPNYIFYHITPIAYLASDIVFELILALCSFLSILFLYKPCDKVLERLLKN